MNAHQTEQALNDPKLYPLGIVYITEPPCPMVIVHNKEEILPDAPFFLALTNVEEN